MNEEGDPLLLVLACWLLGESWTGAEPCRKWRMWVVVHCFGEQVVGRG